jgi:hypothetical protein
MNIADIIDIMLKIHVFLIPQIMVGYFGVSNRGYLTNLLKERIDNDN